MVIVLYGCMTALAPHELHCFSRIIQQQSRPSGKNMMASTMPHIVNESVITPFCGETTGDASEDRATTAVTVSRTSDDGGWDGQFPVFVWLASHVLPYLSHRNVT